MGMAGVSEWLPGTREGWVWCLCIPGGRWAVLPCCGLRCAVCMTMYVRGRSRVAGAAGRVCMDESLCVDDVTCDDVMLMAAWLVVCRERVRARGRCTRAPR